MSMRNDMKKCFRFSNFRFVTKSGLFGICRDFQNYVINLRLLYSSQGPLSDYVDQDQTAQNIQSDLSQPLSEKEIFSSKIKFRWQDHAL